MKRLGVSVFLGLAHSLEENVSYLTLARELGYTRVFTSLHIPEADARDLAANFARLVWRASELGMDVVADISPRALPLFGAGSGDLKPLESLGLKGIRVDFGFSPAEIAAMVRGTQSLRFELNASTVTSEELEGLIAAGADPARLQACHNYYPRPETGISEEMLVSKSMVFRRLGIPTAAFIPSLENARGPIRAGLPTIEEHRSLGPLVAAKHLWATGVIDEVIFGDPHASQTELAAVASLEPDVIQLRVRTVPGLSPQEEAVLFGGTHTNRPDAGHWVIRSQESRTYATQGAAVPSGVIGPREAFSVTVDNENYLRYAGELQITRRDLPADPRVNVAGQVVPEERFLVGFIGPGSQFSLVREE